MSELTDLGGQEITAKDLIRSLRAISQSSEITGQLTDSKLAYKVTPQLWWHNPDHSRNFFLGNEHHNIHGFLKVIDQLGPRSGPLTIVNFDEHIDDSQYAKAGIINGSGLNASWQRYLVDIGRTDLQHSINVMPDKLVYPDSEYTQEMSLDRFDTQLKLLSKIDILSLDLDYFNKLQPGSKRWVRSINILKACAGKSSSLMIFTSPVFTTHLQSIEIARTLFEEIKKSEV